MNREVFVDECLTDPDLPDEREEVERFVDELIEEGVFIESDDGERITPHVRKSVGYIARHRFLGGDGDE